MIGAAQALLGVLSDTHGDVPGWVLKLFHAKNVTAIIHAGDAVDDTAVSRLSSIAPLTIVRGNMDVRGDQSAVVEFCGHFAYVVHSIDHLDIDPVAAGMKVVITGHTHVPSIEWRNGILYLNPGSASHPRWGNPPSVAIIEVEGRQLRPSIWFEDSVGNATPAAGTAGLNF